MKDFLIKLLEEHPGEISTMRVMSLILVIVGSGIGIYGVMYSKDLGGVAELTAVFIGTAVGGKVSQKFTEGK